MRSIIIIALALFLGQFSSYSQDGDVKGTTPSNAARTASIIRVTDSIYMLKGKGGNIGISKGEDGILMIDDQFATGTEEILNLVKSLSDKPIQFLVNTHHHGDHTGGNRNMIARGTVVYAQDNARKRMIASEKNKFDKKQGAALNKLVEDLNKSGDKEKAVAKAKEKGKDMPAFVPSEHTYPMITFSKDMTFYYNGEKVMVFHVHNAHTDGDVIVYFTQSNVLHTGDVFFNGRYPYIDVKSGGSYDGYVKALSQILTLIDDETKIIPGHGELGNKGNMKYSHDMMVALKNSVSFHVLSGKTKEEVLAMNDISKEYDAAGFGDYFITTEKFIGMIYDEAKRKYPNPAKKQQ
ncbi:MAG: MBL fold metallo-hydrolase [Flavobacteriaceae bacterium]|nr:MBL fold metallo-hydrolase [Flavobacteriaceae bacterium]